jgi:translation initiation factor 4E
MTNATPEASKPVGRLPTLNALAARININNPALGASGHPTSVSAPRPRLAASVLRTGSTTSLATTASTTDSVVVNVPSTRSTSPSALSLPIPPARSITPFNDNVAGGAAAGTGDPLTSEKLEKHNQETLVADKPTKGRYKNIPSLDAITARLAKTRTLSVDGTAKPPEPEMIEDPKTPGVPMKAPEHPLQFPWYVIANNLVNDPNVFFWL